MDRQNHSRIDILMGRLFLSLIALTAVFMMCEWISRKLLDPRPPIERRFPVQHTRHPRPYSMFSGKPHAPDLNSLGYRGDVPPMPKSPGECRIFFLGGSTVYRGDPAIPEMVQDMFQDHGFPNVRAYNFGVVSSVSGMELARIVFEISDLAPDWIVMYNGGNDIHQPWDWDPRPGYPFNFIVYENNPILDKDLKTYPATALLLYGSNIMRYLFPGYFIQKFVPLERARKESGYQSPEWREEIADIYVNNLVKADKIARAMDAQFAAFFQPLLYFKDSLHAEERPYENREMEKFARTVRESILSRIDRLEGDPPLRFVDLSRIYSADTSYIFIDGIHTRQETMTVAALAIYQELSAAFMERTSNTTGGH